MASGPTTLPDHLYTRGLLSGRHSDITVIAFGHKYRLHRLLLDRAPFFTTALSEPWLESKSKEITLRPEEIDSNITQTSFELALKRLYGCDISAEEDREAIGLFATGCWLEMQDLVDSSINAIMRQMSPKTVSSLIRLVTTNYYGRAGERILASAKAMLCRNGWEMPLKCWDGIPGDIVREMVGGDGLFINGEWERWVLAKRLLDRRLKQKAVEAELIEPGMKGRIKAPDTFCLMAVRFDTVYRHDSITTGREMPDDHIRWLTLYTHPDVEPLLVLLDEGIHYIHLDFEQLQYIRQARDVFGLPIMPEKVITNALWTNMELRQKVLNARELDMELGLSKPAEEPSLSRFSSDSTVVLDTSLSPKGKQKYAGPPPEEVEEDEMESGSWDANGKPRKFWIPSTDCNIVMGGNADPVVTTSSASQRNAIRLSATLQPQDVQWATDFAATPSTVLDGVNRPMTPARSSVPSTASQPKPIAYTHFPPFRFSAEFPNPRLLKEKRRVYSRTVFYAGSLWNIYIQKISKSARSPQLGVYLHRAKEKEPDEVGGSSSLAQTNVGSVDERIGLLEREMLLRSEGRRRLDTRTGRVSSAPDAAAQGDTSSSGGDPDATLVPAAFRRRRSTTQSSATSSSAAGGGAPTGWTDSDFDSDSDSNPDSDGDGSSRPASRIRNPIVGGRPAPHRLPSARTPALPPYVDARPTIKTYFKIYSPSRGGRMLSVYESAPDKFNFSQSWGWKSSTLMLDEGLMGSAGPARGEAGGDGAAAAGGGLEGEGKEGEGEGREKGRGRREREGMLRFMVVIGNL